ncbi:hypothetical protein CGRA01v4_12585 [Colletotrichum graminicola]|nr:hypothetical protein CGRA01v4_12585 [Colletotrichum graminicola]
MHPFRHINDTTVLPTGILPRIQARRSNDRPANITPPPPSYQKDPAQEGGGWGKPTPPVSVTDMAQLAATTPGTSACDWRLCRIPSAAQARFGVLSPGGAGCHPLIPLLQVPARNA